MINVFINCSSVLQCFMFATLKHSIYSLKLAVTFTRLKNCFNSRFTDTLKIEVKQLPPRIVISDLM